MAIAYFDCFAGAGGDMIVASLVHAGADAAALLSELKKLRLPSCDISLESLTRAGIVARKFNVRAAPEHHHRHLADIVELIDGADLPPRAAARAKAIFERLAQAEAKVHATAVENVHFHEVGAADSILDIVGACVAMDLLAIDAVYCSPIPTGSGLVKMDHGTFPVPAPATAELLRDAPTYGGDIEGEMTTPTAAAVLTTLAKHFGPLPPMRVAAVGYGAGSRFQEEFPNLLRVFVGQSDEAGDADAALELSANIDDCTGEILGATIEQLLAAGCLDAWATPIVMKKSRPAWMLSALCAPGDADRVRQILFSETTTFGIRCVPCRRTKLERRHETVETPYGPIRIKIGSQGGAVQTASPEFGDCRQAAACHHVSIKEVFEAARSAYRVGASK